MKYILSIVLIFILSSKLLSQTIIQMKTESGVSIIPCKVNGLSLSFIFDTGASEVSISMTEASFMFKNGFINKDDILGSKNFMTATGQITEGISINLRELEIGGIVIKNIKANVVKTANSPLLLGRSAIDSLGKIEIDFSNGILKVYSSKINSNNSLNSKFELGISKMDEEEYSEAITLFSDIIKLDRTYTDAYFKRGICYTLVNKYLEAMNDLNYVLKLQPENHVAFFYRGISYMNMDLIKESLSDIYKSIRIKPDFLFSYTLIGEYHMKNKKNDSALYYYNKAISIDSSQGWIYSERALLYYYMQKYSNAFNDYNRALILDPSDLVNLLGRAEVNIELKNIIDAQKDLDYLVNQNIHLARAYYLKGRISSHYGDKKQEYEFYQLAKKHNSGKELLPFDELMISIVMAEFEKEKWELMHDSKDNISKFYVSNKNISNKSNTKVHWCKSIEKSRTMNIGSKKNLFLNIEVKILLEFNCDTKLYKQIESHIYSSNGKLLKSENLTENDWQTIVPGTILDKVFKYVCSL